jgi:hypothetical protein
LRLPARAAAWHHGETVQRAAPSVVILSLLAALGSCGSDASPSPSAERAARAPAEPQAHAARPPDSEVTAPAAQPAAAVAELRFAGQGLPHDLVIEHLSRAQPLSFAPVSASGTVLRVRLAAPFDAAFKPVTPALPLGPSAEVAAYRLARCLGMDNVPPAVSRAVPAADVAAALVPDAKQSWNDLRARLTVSSDGAISGAAIFWIPQLADVGVDRRDGLRRIGAFLRAGAELPEASRSLAASVSSMLAFDYLIGNFDRWSGGNVSGDANATLVYVRDHDLAFPSRMTEPLHRRLWEDLHHSERFSRRLYTAFKALTRERFERELARDPAGARGRLLGERQLQGVFDRREALISYVESLIALHGEAAVLTFD